MEPKGFSVGEMVKFGWRTTWANKWFLLGIILTMFVLMGIPYAGAMYLLTHHNHMTTGQWFGFSGLMVLTFIIAIWMSLGAQKISLRFAEGVKPKFKDLFIGFSYVWKFFLGHLLYLLVTFVGLLLFVIPGVIWAMRYSMFSYHIIEHGVGPIDAFKMSARTTYGGKWDIFAYQFVASIVNYLGILCLIVGMFVTIPMIMIGMAYAYRKLLSKTEVAVPSVTTITNP